MASNDERQRRIVRMQRIRAKVVEWAAQNEASTLESAVRCWIGARTPSKDKVKEAFLFALIAPPAVGPSLLEQYQAQADTLSRFEREMFDIWAGVRFSVFEVASVEEGVGIEMRDLISEDIVSIREKTASKTIQRGDWLAAFLKQVKGQDELEGTIAMLDGEARNAAIMTLQSEREARGLKDKETTPDATRRCAQPVIKAIRHAEQP